MFPCLQEFTSGIDGLLSYIALEEATDEYFREGASKYVVQNEAAVDLKFFVATFVSRGATTKKRFLYNSMIVSLYGYLESFLEKLVEEYITRVMVDCGSALNMPLKIKEQHLELSIDLLRTVRRDRNLSKEEKNVAVKRIVANMNSCVNDDENISLNENAYSIHTANFRYDVIHLLFERVGISGVLRLALDDKALQSEIVRIYLLTGDPDKKLLISLLSAELDDLAQRRNEVSHGNLNSDLQSLDMFRSRATFIRVFGIAIHQVLVGKADVFLFSVAPKVELGKPAKVFAAKRVLGFNYKTSAATINLILKTGDDVFSYNQASTRPLQVGKIVAIMVDGVACDLITLDRDFVLTVEVDFILNSHSHTRTIFVRKNTTQTSGA